MAHTHISLSREVDGVSFVNPGSVGRPYDGDPAASYALLTAEPFSLEIVRVNYNVGRVVRDMRKSRLPEEYAQALLRSIPVDGLRQLDADLEGRSMRGRLAEVRRVAAGYGEADDHSAQVRRLSLKIFDQLAGIHGLSRRERYMLEAAALLHDIGWSEGQRAHHKTSLRLIMDDVELPLATRERLIIGSIARYHRKGPPKKKHYNYGKLQKEDRRAVQVLSAILRVADGMDYGHSSVVRNVGSSFDDDRVILKCTGRGDHQYEDRQVAKKKGLFERVFCRALELEWSPR
jgi:exopolyphosphatase/guanosine-5'-triphosphate,3'-diphosphate pyrophosphatase